MRPQFSFLLPKIKFKWVLNFNNKFCSFETEYSHLLVEQLIVRDKGTVQQGGASNLLCKNINRPEAIRMPLVTSTHRKRSF